MSAANSAVIRPPLMSNTVILISHCTLAATTLPPEYHIASRCPFEVTSLSAAVVTHSHSLPSATT